MAAAEALPTRRAACVPAPTLDRTFMLDAGTAILWVRALLIDMVACAWFVGWPRAGRGLAEGWTVAAVAASFGIDPKTVRKWRGRHVAPGEAGLADRSSRPHRSPARLDRQAEDAIETLRRRRLSGPAIARRLRRPVSTVGVVLRRRGLGRLAALDPKPPVIRYERERPGALVPIDIKKLGRIDGVGHRVTGDRARRARRIGWEYLHVAVDDCSRLAYTVLPGEGQDDATAFLGRALAWLAAHGVTVERVTTDNGSAYNSKRFGSACARHGVKHQRIRPHTFKANGRAERFIQGTIREWAHAAPFASFDDRAAAMRPRLHRDDATHPPTPRSAATRPLTPAQGQPPWQWQLARHPIRRPFFIGTAVVWLARWQMGPRPRR